MSKFYDLLSSMIRRINDSVKTVDGMAGDSNGNVRISRPYNLLDNSDFRNPVDQRGLGCYEVVSNAPQYTIDRWYCKCGLVDHTDVLEGRCVHLFYDQVNSELPALMQYIDSKLIVDDKKYTFAIRDEIRGTFLISGKFKDTVDEYDLEMSYDDSKSAYVVKIKSAFRLVWAALYEGEYTLDTLPDYVPKGYGAELVECQRYYVGFGSDAYSCVFAAFASTATNIRATIPVPVVMRTTPTCSLTAENIRCYMNSGSTTATITPTNIDSITQINNCIVLRLTVDSTTAGSAGVMRIKDAASAFEFSADF